MGRTGGDGEVGWRGHGVAQRSRGSSNGTGGPTFMHGGEKSGAIP